MRLARLDPTCGLLPGFLRIPAVVTDAAAADGVIWIDVPGESEGDVVDRLDAWLVWALPHAFETQQELVLEGAVDAELLGNAQRLMEIWSQWRPARRPIPIRADVVAATDGPPPRRTGLFFTAGADSYFTLLHRDAAARETHARGRAPGGDRGSDLGEGPADARIHDLIHDLIYVWGFDIPLKNRAAFDAKRATLSRIAAETGKTPVFFATNLRESGIRQPWGPVMHGPALGGVGLLLGNRWRTVLTSSFLLEGDDDAWGSTPLTDALLSTSATRTEPYGETRDRLEKLAFVTRTPIALDTLHVCWEERSERNCGRCEKCFRTMLALEIVGVRERCSTFPREPLDLGHLARIWKDRPNLARTYARLQAHADRAGRHEVASAIGACLARETPSG